MNHDVTRILSEIEQGNADTAEQLLPLVYKELRRLAAAKMAQESPDHSLQATALVHEAFLRLVDRTNAQAWQNRGHFFSAAAESMRRILVESARRKQGPQRGGDLQRVNADLDGLTTPRRSPSVLAVDEALKSLAEHDPSVAKLVELRFFAGLTLKEAAIALGVSDRTADRYWVYAKAWLHRAITNDSEN